MTTITATYDDPESAQRAFEMLRTAGVSSTNIVVLSSEPLEQYAFGRDESHTWMPWLAALGGVVGGTLGFTLTATAQTLWPLQTGSMPIITLGTNAIIVYELTMLGAIVTTLLVFLASAGLPKRRTSLYDPAVAEGKILIGVKNPGAAVSKEIVQRLREMRGRVNVVDV
ncbi:MAG: DUF3341 domain-containing protein [Acidobacteria bacterium]|nr:DUF3341 domain-containing protein [Acidobacteriota bacterium]